MNHLLLILIGGPVLMGGPPLLAVWLCERHANQTAAAIRAQHGDQVPAPARSAAARPSTTRPKALVR